MAETKMLHTKAEVVSKGIKADEGVIDAIVGSSNVLDRIGDVIDQAGWKLQNYKKTNPVILWGHNQKEQRPPIGKALKVWIQDKGEKTAKLMFKVKFDLQDNFAKEIFRKIKDGFINTVSVGFLPIEWKLMDEDDPFSGKKYTKQELLELSFVPVPANPEALVALKGMKDERFAPVELKDLYQQKGEPIDITKPYPNEHACRLKSPGLFKPESFKRMTRSHKGKKYGVIMGRLKGETTMTEQSYRYPKGIWDASSARAHCKAHKGIGFSPATGKAEEKREYECLECNGETEKPSKELGDKSQIDEQVKPTSEEKPAEKEKLGTKSTKDEFKEKEPKAELEKSEVPAETKGVIPFKDLGVAPESEPWDGPGEKAKAEVSDLKLMCAWYDSEKPDVKGSYKLPHHKATGHKCVWRGVAAAMAAILGARGGVQIPTGDRKGIYNHLKKHYLQFDKKAPDFKMVEGQVLAGLDEEIHALMLDREDRYMVRLIKKVLKRQTEVKKVKIEEVKTKYTQRQIESALEVLDSALSQISVSSQKGGEKKG